MKRLLLLLVLTGCSINRWVERIEIPANQVWDVYTELHVIQVDSCRRFQRITAVPYGKPYPKYSYRWEDYRREICIGDIVPLTDSLRSQIDYTQNWKRLRTR